MSPEEVLVEIRDDLRAVRDHVYNLSASVSNVKGSLAVLGAVVMVILAAVLAGCERPSYPSPPLSPEVADQAVVALLMPNGVAYCTGFYVRERIIVTASHCVSEEAVWLDIGLLSGLDPSQSHWERENIKSGLLLSRDEDNDIALLVGPEAPAVLRLSPSLPRVGTHVTSIGHPRGLVTYTHQFGRVSHGLRAGVGGSPAQAIITTDTPIIEGMSGGPTIVEATGQVIGVTVSRLPGEVLGGVSPAAPIIRMLERINI